MAVISITPTDLLASTKVEAGAYKGELSSYECKPSKSGKGTNFWLAFTITDGKYKGKEHKALYTTAATGDGGILGDLQTVPKTEFARIKSAITGEPIKDGDIDLDTLLHQPMDLIFGVVISDGKVNNVLTGYAPVGKGSGGPVW